MFTSLLNAVHKYCSLAKSLLLKFERQMFVAITIECVT
jgi:hypothetical protein